MAFLLGIFFTVGGIACFLASHLLATHSLAGESPLTALYIRGAIKTIFETGLLFFLSAVLFFCYALLPKIRLLFTSLTARAGLAAQALPRGVRLALLFTACGVAIFLLNAGGIIHGYFLYDDFPLLAQNSSHSLTQLIMMPSGLNDSHLTPLYRVEIFTFYYLFGVNTLPYNLFLLLLATALVYLTYLLLRALGFDKKSFLIFAVIFGGSIILSAMLAGFYNLTMYIRILVLFVLSLWTYTLWSSSPSFPRRQFLFIVSLASAFAATFVDISGFWVPGAYLLFSLFYEIAVQGRSLRTSLRKNVPIFVGVFGIGTLMAIYGWYAYASGFHFTPGNHLGVWDVTKSLYGVLTSGVIAQLWLPSAGFVIDQPRLMALVPIWSGFMALLFLMFLSLLYIVLRYGSKRARYCGSFFLLLMIGTALLPAWARPSYQPAAFYHVETILMPFYWFVLLLSVAVAEYLKRAEKSPRYEGRALLVIALCISIFAAQHASSFYNSQSVKRAEDLAAGIHLLQSTLSPALNALASNASGPIGIPDLRGSYVVPPLSPDVSMAQVFLGLSPKIQFISTRSGPYLASTSVAFLSALKSNAAIRSFYLKPILMEVDFGPKLTDSISPTSLQSDGSARLIVSPTSIAPSRKHTLVLDMASPGHPEKIFIKLGFNDTYGGPDPKGTIRIDQFSPLVPDQVGRYSVIVDLDQLYAYALSSEISDLTLTFTTPGVYEIYAVDIR